MSNPLPILLDPIEILIRGADKADTSASADSAQSPKPLPDEDHSENAKERIDEWLENYRERTWFLSRKRSTAGKINRFFLRFVFTCWLSLWFTGRQTWKKLTYGKWLRIRRWFRVCLLTPAVGITVVTTAAAAPSQFYDELASWLINTSTLPLELAGVTLDLDLRTLPAAVFTAILLGFVLLFSGPYRIYQRSRKTYAFLALLVAGAVQYTGIPEATPELIIKSLTWINLVFLIGFLTMCIAGWLGLKAVSPEMYASIVADFESENSAVDRCSELIERLCSDFLRSTAVYRFRFFELYLLAKRVQSTNELNPHIVNTLSDFHDTAKEDKFYRDYSEAVGRFLYRNRKELNRLEHVKTTIAERLSIPPRNLCDFIFQFSPSIFEPRVEKAEQNINEVGSSLSIVSKQNRDQTANFQEAVRRTMSLCVQIERITRFALRATMRQRVINEHHDQRHYVSTIVKQHASSGAIQSYAKALQSLDQIKDEKDYLNCLEFLYDVQRAHPSANAHRRIKSILNELSNQETLGESERNHVVGAIDDLEFAETRLKQGYANLDFFTEGAKLSAPKPSGFWSIFRQSNQFIHDQREARSSKLLEDLTTRLNENPTSNCVHILILNYSRMVRNAMSKLCAEDKHDFQVVFCIGGDKRWDVSRRMLRHELLYETAIKRNKISQIPYDRVASIKHSLPEDAIVYCLLGTEAYDGDGLFLMPEEPELVKAIRRLFREEWFMPVLVAEEYKKEEDISDWVKDTRKIAVSQPVELPDKSFHISNIPSKGASEHTNPGTSPSPS